MNKNLASQIEQMQASARQAGRDPADIGIECIIPSNSTADQVRSLQDKGVTHVAMVTMNQKLPDPAAHVDAITRARDMLAGALA